MHNAFRNAVINQTQGLSMAAAAVARSNAREEHAADADKDKALAGGVAIPPVHLAQPKLSTTDSKLPARTSSNSTKSG